MLDDRLREVAEALRLLDAPTVGPRRALQLLVEFGSATEATRGAVLSGKVSRDVADFLASRSLDQYLQIIARTHEIGGDILLWSDARYPRSLTEWEARPPILFYKGDLSGLDENALALVGRVDPTPEGEAAAARFARLCVDEGIAVVSGLAKGIDAASHRGALETANGRTYAVIGHGLDFAYPHENAELYEAIPTRGALISQFNTGFGPQRWTFPARNEVMCTVALGTVIVEGKRGCGSLIQADFSFKHHRPVFVLGRNLESVDAEWATSLVGRGAHVVRQFSDVSDVIEPVLRRLRADRPIQPGLGMLLSESLPTRSISSSQTAALFDIDGVIVDTRSATAAALASIASSQLGRPVDPSEVQVTGKPHDALTRLGVRDAYSVYRQGYDAAFELARGEVRVFDDVVQALLELKRRGAKLGAVTAQPRRRAEVMLPPAVRNLFDEFLCYNDTRGRKDEGIRMALRRFAVDPIDAVFVGDQSTDLEAAAVVGVRAVGVLWGFSTEADLECHAHSALVRQPSGLGATVTELLGV